MESKSLLWPLCCPLLTTSVAAQSPAFAYQGRLNDGGHPANGNYDLFFSVWTAPSGPSQIGGGVTSTKSQYSASGTIGQPDPDHVSGGNHTLDGGYLGTIAAVQTVCAPLLTIALNSQP